MFNLKTFFSVASIVCVTSTSWAIADENKATSEASTSTSKNPITGTVTKKKKRIENQKNARGEEVKAELIGTTKYKKDGSVEQNLEVERSTTQQ